MTLKKALRTTIRKIFLAVVADLMILSVLSVAPEVGADTLNFYDPNGNGTAAAFTQSECTGFFTVTITWTIQNEAMENKYTIDWKAPPFKVTLVEPGGTRKASASSYKSCPEKEGSVDWIDIPNTAPPNRGIQTFPAPTQYHGWVILDFIGDLLNWTGGNPTTEAVLYDEEEAPLVSYTSVAKPVNPEDPIGSPWKYEYTLTNHSEESYDFTVKVLEPPQTVFSGQALPGESAQLVFESSCPCGVGAGAVFIETTGEIFPAASFVPTPTVGGIYAPVDKFGLLAPYIGLASTILVATVATAIYAKRVKRRKAKNT